jgi:hypothetical protein
MEVLLSADMLCREDGYKGSRPETLRNEAATHSGKGVLKNSPLVLGIVDFVYLCDPLAKLD